MLSLFLGSCCTSKDTARDFGSDAFSLTGTMKYLAIEGGCWQFTADDGATYQVSGEEAKRLLKDGQRAEIIVRDLPNRRTICMTGKSVELLKIIKLH